MSVPLGFFTVSRLQPRHSTILLAGCLALGIWTMSYDANELDSSLGIVLIVQLFLVSTGFTARAFAGHFDAVLVAGASRRGAALAHFLASVAPGVVAWGALALTGLALGSHAALSAVWGRRAVALLIVSTIGWAGGYRLPRGAAAVVWLALLVAILLQHDLRALSMSLDHGQHGWPWETLVVVVCPFLLIGDAPFVPVGPLILATVFSILILLAMVAATERLDVVLRERG